MNTVEKQFSRLLRKDDLDKKVKIPDMAVGGPNLEFLNNGSQVESSCESVNHEI